MNIQLPTGTTITMSVYEYFFLLDDKDVDLFYQSCIAENIGVYIENPFSNGYSLHSKIEVNVEDEPDELNFEI